METRTHTKRIQNTFRRTKANSANPAGRNKARNENPNLGGNQLYSIKWTPFHFVDEISSTDLLKELYRVYALNPHSIDFSVNPLFREEQLCFELYSRLIKVTPQGYKLGFYAHSENPGKTPVRILFYKPFDNNSNLCYVSFRSVAGLKESHRNMYRFLCGVFKSLLQQGLTQAAGSMKYFRDELTNRFEEDLCEHFDEPEERENVIAGQQQKLQDHDHYEKEYVRFMSDCKRTAVPTESLRKFALKHKLTDRFGDMVNLGLDLADNPKGTKLADFLCGIAEDDNIRLYPDRYFVCGWDEEAPIEVDYFEGVDSEANEGVVSPAHIFEIKDAWEVPLVDTEYLDKLQRFFRLVNDL